MGQYPITAGVFGKALAIPGTGNGGTITTPSAWLFENQSGTLGTNYNSSQIYVGVTGDVVAILSDTVGAQDTVTGLNLQAVFTGANPSYTGFAAGSGYDAATNVATTVTSLVGSATGALNNGVGFTSSFGGGFTFDGTDDDISISPRSYQKLYFRI